MTFDDEAIEAAAKLEFDDWAGLSEFDRKHFMATMEAAIEAALTSMKERGVDPCAEARREELELCAKIADEQEQSAWSNEHIARKIRALEDEK